jgi:hypothetical protein
MAIQIGTLYRYNGKILNVDGALATAQRCCCLDCNCDGWEFEIVLDTLDEAEVDAVVAALIAYVNAQNFLAASGYDLSAIVSCIGREYEGGEPQDVIKIHVLFRCCAGSDGSLDPCFNTDPGEDPPEGRRKIQDLMADFMADYGSHTLFEVGPQPCVIPNWFSNISCAFSDPVVGEKELLFDQTKTVCCQNALDIYEV